MTGSKDIVVTKEVKVLENTHKVTLVVDDHQTVIEVVHGDKISEKFNPKKDGYIFKGWYEDKDGKVKYDNKGVEKDLTLYGKWEKIEKNVQISYIIGYPDNTFGPHHKLTRAEAATMFVRLMTEGKESIALGGDTPFSDADDMWYSKYINHIYQAGLLKGYPDGTFKPNQPITRGEFAQMISGYVKGYSQKTQDVKDIKGHWAKEAIEKVYGQKIVQGYPDGTFKPNQDITRAEAVTILNAAFGRRTIDKSFGTYVNISETKDFKDISARDWFYYEVLDASNTHEVDKTKDEVNAFDIWTKVYTFIDHS